VGSYCVLRNATKEAKKKQGYFDKQVHGKLKKNLSVTENGYMCTADWVIFHVLCQVGYNLHVR
jgi:hypothetical protein